MKTRIIISAILFVAASLPVTGQIWEMSQDSKVTQVCDAGRQKEKMLIETTSTETVSVTIKSDGQPINNFIIVGEGAQIQSAGASSQSRTFKIPKGEYTLGAMFIRSMPMMHWDLRENILISGDTIISMDAERASNRIKFRPTGPDDCDLKLPDYRYNPVLEIDYKDANVHSQSVCNVICHKSGLTFAILSGQPIGRNSNGVDDGDNYDFMVPALSDDIVMAQYRMVRWMDGSVSVIQLETTGCQGPKVVGNRSKEFIGWRSQFDRSASFDNSNVKDAKKVVYGQMSRVNKGNAGMVLQMLSDDYEGAVNASIADVEETHTSMSVCVMDCEMSQQTQSGISVAGIESVPMFVCGGKWIRSDSGTSAFMDSEYRFGSDGKPVTVWPGHDFFSGGVERFGVEFGASVPVNCFLLQHRTSNNKPVIVFMPHYIGMAGESRSIDNYYTRTTVLSGDRIIATGTGPVMMDYQTVVNAGRLKVKFENKNISIGGEIGSNVSEYEFSFSGGDKDAPSLRRLAVRNSKGRLTNMLSEDEEVTLLLTAGDFNLPSGALYHHIEDVEVNVECTRHGDEDWRRVELSIVAGYERRAAFGTLYEGRLDHIACIPGWYDLKVSLRDTEGNSSVQTLSRAFLVGGHGKAYDIWDEQMVQVAGRRIIAPEGAEIIGPSGVRTCKEELMPGVYIVKYGTFVKKVIVK